jgi:hypothetical protein
MSAVGPDSAYGSGIGAGSSPRLHPYASLTYPYESDPPAVNDPYLTLSAARRIETAIAIGSADRATIFAMRSAMRANASRLSAAYAASIPNPASIGR